MNPKYPTCRVYVCDFHYHAWGGRQFDCVPESIDSIETGDHQKGAESNAISCAALNCPELVVGALLMELI